MITDILLLSGVFLTVVAVSLFLSAWSRAPDGIEDETGFHYREDGSPVSRPPFVSKGMRLRAKKNAGRFIPAA